MKALKSTFAICLLACSVIVRAQIMNAAGQPPRIGQLTAQNQLPVSVPYGLVNGTIVLQASIKDNQPQNAVIATSLPICMIRPDSAPGQGVEAGDLTKFHSLFGEKTVSGAKPQIIHVGKATVNAVPMGMFDPLEALSGRKEANTSMPALWLGNSFLGVFTLYIDPEKQEVGLKAVNATMPGRATIVPFEVDNGRLVVLAKVGGVSFKAIIDTTSMATFIPARTAHDAKITPDVTFPITSANGKKGVVGIGTVSDLVVGDINIPLPRVLFLKEGDSGGMDPELGILGNDFLLRHKVTINYAQGRIAFERLNSNAVQGSGATPVKSVKPDPKASKTPDKTKKGAETPPAVTPPGTAGGVDDPSRAADPATTPPLTEKEKKALAEKEKKALADAEKARKAEEAKAAKQKAEEEKAKKAEAEKLKAEEKKAAEKKAKETKPDEKKPDDKKPDEKKPPEDKKKAGDPDFPPGDPN